MNYKSLQKHSSITKQWEWFSNDYLQVMPTQETLKHGNAHVNQHGLQGIVTVSYKTYRDAYHNTYQISGYVSLVEKVYRYTPTNKASLGAYTRNITDRN
jgi:hypothetical protein